MGQEMTSINVAADVRGGASVVWKVTCRRGCLRLQNNMARNPSFQPIDAGVKIGHVHLKVANLDRALKFYRDVLGFEITTRYGPKAVFLSAGGYHHHIGLNTWESLDGAPPPRGATG